MQMWQPLKSRTEAHTQCWCRKEHKLWSFLAGSIVEITAETFLRNYSVEQRKNYDAEELTKLNKLGYIHIPNAFTAGVNCMIQVVRAVWPWSMVYCQSKRFNSSNGCHRQWNFKNPERRVFT